MAEPSSSVHSSFSRAAAGLAGGHRRRRRRGNWPSAEVDCAFAGAHVAVLPGPAGAGQLQRHHRSEERALRTVCLARIPDGRPLRRGHRQLPVANPITRRAPWARLDSAKDPSADDPATGSSRRGAARRDRNPARRCADLSGFFVHRQPARLEPAEPLRSPIARLFWLHARPVHLGLQRGSHRPAKSPARRPRVRATNVPSPIRVRASGRLAGGKLADFVQAPAGSPRRYQMVLSPGRYRITSGHLRPRRIVVRAGMVENIGRFGACRPLRVSHHASHRAFEGLHRDAHHRQRRHRQ